VETGDDLLVEEPESLLGLCAWEEIVLLGLL